MGPEFVVPTLFSRLVVPETRAFWKLEANLPKWFEFRAEIVGDHAFLDFIEVCVAAEWRHCNVLAAGSAVITVFKNSK